MLRVSILGNSGAGKTTLAALSSELSIPHVEPDCIHHLQDWTPMPESEFAAHVLDVEEVDGWVVDGNLTTGDGGEASAAG